MAKHYIIYETKNLKDGKIYIGMHETNNLEDGYLGSGKRLKRAIRYYGKEFFERKILFTFDNCEDMIAKEIELVNEDFIKRKDTYNIALGGKGGIRTEELKQKWIKSGSAARSSKLNKLWKDKEWSDKRKSSMKELWEDKDYRERCLKNWNVSRKHTNETKNKMKENRKGKQSGYNNSQYGTCWINNGKESKKIFKGDLIPNGWKLGRKIK